MKPILVLLIGFAFATLSNVGLASDVGITKVSIEYEDEKTENVDSISIKIENVSDEQIFVINEMNLDTAEVNYSRKNGREFIASGITLDSRLDSYAERRSRIRKSLQDKTLKPSKGTLKRPAKKWVY